MDKHQDDAMSSDIQNSLSVDGDHQYRTEINRKGEGKLDIF